MLLTSIQYLPISWSRWFVLTLLILAIYFLIHLIYRATTKMGMLGGWKQKASDFIRYVYVLSEPVCLVIILSGFMLINPILHGLLILALFVIGYPVIKSYFTGKLFQLSRKCYLGQKIKFQSSEGFIKSIGRTSLTLQTQNGALHASYSQLFENGFTQLQGKEVGGIISIHIDTSQYEGKTSIQQLKNKIWESPYVDWSFDPEIYSTNKENQYEVKVLLVEKNHLDDLTSLITEWGYTCHLKK